MTKAPAPVPSIFATGLGKTYLAAFDSADFERVLFVAHREEILQQALVTFQRVRPEATLGLYSGKQKDPHADVLFAMVQTLQGKLDEFEPRRFDYMVVDEFHHATADSYRKVIDHFRPSFLLGLTATPDRMDGADILELCEENEIFEAGILDGIEEGSLCRFHYFGIPDHVDVGSAWKRGKFDITALSELVRVEERAERAHAAWAEHRGTTGRTLAFCVDRQHADFMARHFNDVHGVPSVAVHSGESSAPRATALKQLAAGKLKVVFSVDMFNEGVDVPAIDTVLMLRPTGLDDHLAAAAGARAARRGRQEAPGDRLHRQSQGLPRQPRGARARVRVQAGGRGIAYGEPPEFPCGAARRGWEDEQGRLQHRLQAAGTGRHAAAAAQAEQGAASVPRVVQGAEEQREQNGRRPTAVESFHAGFDPGDLNKKPDGWFDLLQKPECSRRGTRWNPRPPRFWRLDRGAIFCGTSSVRR